MTPAKIKEHEPTAVSRDPNNQTIVGQGQTGTDSQEATEEYRRRGMNKVGEYNTTLTQQQQKGNKQEVRQKIKHLKPSMLQKKVLKVHLINLKQEQKQLEKKVSDPDTSLEEEYNKEKTQE